MRLKPVLITASIALSALCSIGQTALAQSSDPPWRIQAGIDGVVAPNTELELVGSGFESVECAVGMADGSFLFCQVNANLVKHVTLDGKIETYVENTNRSLGLAIDGKGRLISTQSREPRIGVLAPTREILADSFEGQPLVRPNDLVVDSKGGVYFSDPLPPPAAAFRPPPVGRRHSLFYIRPDGALVQLQTSDAGWNGVALSPNGKVLYAVEGDQVTAFDVLLNGSTTKPRKFADIVADGLAVDNSGRLYGGTRAGVEVVAPDGKRLGLIATPKRVQNLAFAGKDRRVLYIVGAGDVYRLPMLAAGIKARLK